MTCQFLHIELYAREKPKKRKSGPDKAWTIDDIIAEVERVPDRSAHVLNPKPPQCIFGIPARAAAEIAKERANASSDRRGYKVRKDTPIILAGIISYPLHMEQVLEPVHSEKYDLWKRDTLSWLKKKYGNSLISAIQHVDESHPHIHFYAVPCPGSGFNAKTLHDGYVAAEKATDPAHQKELYCNAMRKMQDDYFDSVASKYGQGRCGPLRVRLSRSRWHEEKRINAKIQDKKEQLEALWTSEKAEIVDTANRLREEIELKIAALELAVKIEQEEKQAWIRKTQRMRRGIVEITEWVKLRNGFSLDLEGAQEMEQLVQQSEVSLDCAATDSEQLLKTFRLK